jgi:hypothetical protein
MAMSNTARMKRKRAPKPLRVPAIAAVLGVGVFFAGAALASVDVSALGALLFAWGLCSLSMLLVLRRRRATRAAKRRRSV